MTSGKYFSREVMALDIPHIGHEERETLVDSGREY
jgi:hypothetical protein